MFETYLRDKLKGQEKFYYRFVERKYVMFPPDRQIKLDFKNKTVSEL